MQRGCSKLSPKQLLNEWCLDLPLPGSWKLVAPAGQPMMCTSVGCDILGVMRPANPVAALAVNVAKVRCVSTQSYGEQGLSI